MEIRHLKIGLLYFPLLFFLGSCNDGKHQKTMSGHQYFLHTDHIGKKPLENDLVSYHIVQFQNGQQIFSTYETGRAKNYKMPSLDPGNDIKRQITPLTEALMLMSEGDSLTLWINQDALPENLRTEDELVFELKLLSVLNKSDQEKRGIAYKEKGNRLLELLEEQKAGFKNNALEKLIRDENGVGILWNKKGAGPKIDPKYPIGIHYIGQLQNDSSTFKNTYLENKPLEVRLGKNKLLPVLEKYLLQAAAADEFTIFLPYASAYGKAGNSGLGIPEEADLVFYIEVL